jgi:arginine decarboxylase
VHRTKRKNQRIGASIAIAIPEINDSHGYIAEHHQNDCSLDELKRKAEEVAVRMLATTQGIKTSDENKTITSISLSDMKNQCTVHSITEHVTDTESDIWTTVLAAAVFLF